MSWRTELPVLAIWLDEDPRRAPERTPKACQKETGRRLMQLPVPTNPDPEVIDADEIERRWILSKCRGCGLCPIGRAVIMAGPPSQRRLLPVR